jgi:hypothetical protein
MTVFQLRQRGRAALTQAGVLDAAADADWLACALLSCERGDLF